MTVSENLQSSSVAGIDTFCLVVTLLSKTLWPGTRVRVVVLIVLALGIDYFV